jgi:hypothetical protein
MSIKLLIGLPTTRAQMFTATVFSLTSAIRTLIEAGIGYDLCNVDGSEIASARNSIASYCHDRPAYSHLLFVDDDMGFEGETVMALLRAQHDVVGAICPRRQLDLAAVHAAAAGGASVDRASAAGLSFIAPLTDPPAPPKDGLLELAAIGMGVTLIRRAVLTTMVERGAAPLRRPAHGRDTLGQTQVHGFFEPMLDPAENWMLSEDVSFCRRWRERCGGRIFGLTQERIAHVGRFDFEGRYSDRLAIDAG